MSSKIETQVQWSAAASVTLSTASRVDSDAITLNAEDWSGSVQINADNAGTPSAGDVVNCYIKWSNGDVLGDSGDDFDTDEHAQLLCVLDTVAANTPGEDPARKTILLEVAGKKALKISVDAPQAGTRNIVVRARLLTHRPQ